jgi:hypothetical protein
MLRRVPSLCGALLVIAAGANGEPSAIPHGPRHVERVELTGEVAHPDQLSGVTFWENLMIVCPDEGAHVNVFKGRGDRYELATTLPLLDEGDDEIDMEGATSDGSYVYIVGSHSIRRNAVDETATYEKNRKRIAKVRPHLESYSLFRLQLNHRGELEQKERVNLRDSLYDDAVLGPYFEVPGKENGIDIEGVAVKEGKLFVGFRGPVLRGNFAPVLSFHFTNPDDYELKFVDLGGRGIRDLVAVEDGFLILAGPVGEGEMAYKLFHWNGADGIPAEGETAATVAEIGEIPTTAGLKPEGLAVTGETAGEWRLLIVSDGAGTASRWVIPKP